MREESSDNTIARQLALAFRERFPQWMQQRLQSARVAVAGVGGMGSNVAVMLARSGVGELLLVDFDLVDASNLNRQHYFVEDLGEVKVQALQRQIHAINPQVQVQIRRERVTAENAAELFRGWPIVCECFDRPEAKAMLVSSLLAALPEVLVVASSGMAGYGQCEKIEVRHPMRRLYVCGDGTTESGGEAFLMAPRVAVCAGMMADQVLQMILNNNETTPKE